MPPFVASIIFGIGIAGLFYLDRGEKPRISKALLIPMVWMILNTTHPLSFWLGMSPENEVGDVSQAYIEGSPFDRNVVIVLQVAALIVLFTKRAKVGAILRKNALILVYFSFCLLSICWSDFPFVTFKRWVKALGDLEMVLVIFIESDPLGALRSLLTRLGFVLFPLSILFIRYYPDLGRRQTGSWTAEPVGVTTQKNELGIMCMMYGTFFLWRFITVYRDRKDPARFRRLLANGTIIAISMYLLSQCNSTTSIVGFASSAGVLWLASRSAARPARVHVAVLAVLGLTVFALFFNPGGGLVETLGKDPGLTGRRDVWGILLNMKTNPLIGTGFETFWLGRRLEFMRTALGSFPIQEAHNGWIEVYLNLGWMGLCFIGLLVGTGYMRIMACLRRDAEKVCLFLGFLLCALFYSFSEAGFRFLTVSWFFLLLVVVGASQTLSLANSRRGGRVRPANVPSEQMQEYATQGSTYTLTELTQ
jgi:exopolysaccharide production protein ExoQ